MKLKILYSILISIFLTNVGDPMHKRERNSFEQNEDMHENNKLKKMKQKFNDNVADNLDIENNLLILEYQVNTIHGLFFDKKITDLERRKNIIEIVSNHFNVNLLTRFHRSYFNGLPDKKFTIEDEEKEKNYEFFCLSMTNEDALNVNEIEYRTYFPWIKTFRFLADGVVCEIDYP